MRFRAGRILFWFVVLFLFDFLLCYGNNGVPLQFVQDSITNYGTTAKSVFIFVLAFGIPIITFFDAITSSEY